MATAYPFIKQVGEGVEICVRVQPGARRSGFAGVWNDEALKIALRAPAVDGKANNALINFLSETFKIRKSSIFIVTGHLSRCKLIRIEMNSQKTEDMLNQWIQNASTENK